MTAPTYKALNDQMIGCLENLKGLLMYAIAYEAKRGRTFFSTRLDNVVTAILEYRMGKLPMTAKTFTYLHKVWSEADADYMHWRSERDDENDADIVAWYEENVAKQMGVAS